VNIDKEGGLVPRCRKREKNTEPRSYSDTGKKVHYVLNLAKREERCPTKTPPSGYIGDAEPAQ